MAHGSAALPEQNARNRVDRRQNVTGRILPAGIWHLGGASMKYGMLWLLGVPIPVLILIYFMFH
jgi:fatty acid desaturase